MCLYCQHHACVVVPALMAMPPMLFNKLQVHCPPVRARCAGSCTAVHHAALCASLMHRRLLRCCAVHWHNHVCRRGQHHTCMVLAVHAYGHLHGAALHGVGARNARVLSSCKPIGHHAHAKWVTCARTCCMHAFMWRVCSIKYLWV